MATVELDEQLPASIWVHGCEGRENADICGEYVRNGSHHGQAVYQQQGACTTTVIKYSLDFRRWVINREGLVDRESCAAYAEDVDSAGSRHPWNVALTWYVCDSRGQGFVADSGFAVLDVPASLWVLGRASGMETSEICGEYVHDGFSHGRAMYHQKVGGGHCIRYLSGSCRGWVISRSKLLDSDACVAYSYSDEGIIRHPGNAGLTWHVWETHKDTFVVDNEVRVLHVPGTFCFVGLVNKQGKAGVEMGNGEYELFGLSQGRPCYRQVHGHSFVRYLAQSNSWILASNQEGTIGFGFAEACGTHHPGLTRLEWRLFDTSTNVFVPDPGPRAVVAPSTLNVQGPDLQSRIGGTFQLAGVKDGRPLYVKPGSQTVIRYSSQNDWWLIDCDGLAEPSIFGRMYQWLLRGDSATARDQCSAYAHAMGSFHPGRSSLEWLVHDSNTGRFTRDQSVRVTEAPLAVRVQGRAANPENGDIVGDYLLAGMSCGRPAYQKAGQCEAIRFCPRLYRWVIDREGLRDSDCCVAYTDGCWPHPASGSAVWHVFHRASNCHEPDLELSVTVLAEASAEFAVTPTAPIPTTSGLKRGVFPEDASAKRPRVADEQLGLRPDWLGSVGA